MCRWRLFRSVWIKDYEDMRAFSSLVAHTPERFEPITAYVQNATLVQRVGERSWIHLLWMQPSLFLFEDDILISLHIEETSSDATAPRPSTCQRLFAGLPRTPPSSCLRSDYLTLTKPHFVTPRDLTSLVGKFKPAVPVLLTGVTWDAQARFDSDLLTTDPLRILPSESHVAVTSSRYTAETAWLVFVGAQRYLSLTRSIGRLNGSLRASDLTRQVLPSAQRTILVLGKLLCGYQGHKMSFLTLDPHNNANTYTIFHQENDINLIKICTMSAGEDVPERPYSGGTSSIQFTFYSSQLPPDFSQVMTVDSFCVISVEIDIQKPPEEGTSSTGMQYVMACPWEEIVDICAAQEGFIRLQLGFGSHAHLAEFMEAKRTTLGKLDSHISVFFRTEDYKTRAADFKTLADLGDARKHDYTGEL
ncbi:hypothetical protein BC629DRAFT_236212 [Irpex lacteus]|nr:hypothetical protein BC629DRAFT_236212 [Irpex lacteus]